MDLTTKYQSENSSRQNSYYAEANVNGGTPINGPDDGYYYNHQYDDFHHERVRSPSLPPIGRNKIRQDLVDLHIFFPTLISYDALTNLLIFSPKLLADDRKASWRIETL